MARIFEKDGAAAAVGVTASVEAVVSKALGLQVHACRLALNRLQAAIDAELGDDVYIALTEATYWLASVAETDKSLKTDDDVKAVIFVRGRLYHHTASPTFLNDDGVRVWRPASQLPYDPKYERVEADWKAIYVDRLENRPIVDVLRRFEAKF